MAVKFYNEDSGYTLRNKRKLAAWARNTAQEEGFTVGDVSVIICPDEYLLRINNEYLSHNYYTDVITFDYGESGVVAGDIFISADTVADNADAFKTDVAQEMHRVIIHGMLHLCGYKDKNDEEAAVMREKENYYLGKLE